VDLCRWEVLYRWVDRQETWAIVDQDTSHQLMAVVMTGENADTAKTVRAISSVPVQAVVTEKKMRLE